MNFESLAIFRTFAVVSGVILYLPFFLWIRGSVVRVPAK